MNEAPPEDAASFARLHAGELDPGLTPEQRDLLGRIIAKRIERGAKLEAIARAVAHGLPALGEQRAMRLGHDEAVRALGWDQLRALRAQGETRVAVSPAADACPACRVAGGVYPIDGAPPIPVPGCTHTSGCRCLYTPTQAVQTPEAQTGAQAGEPARDRADEQGDKGTERPWYRSRPPRPHGPRWTEEQRDAARRQRGQGQGRAQRDSGSTRGPQQKPMRRDDDRE